MFCSQCANGVDPTTDLFCSRCRKPVVKAEPDNIQFIGAIPTSSSSTCTPSIPSRTSNSTLSIQVSASQKPPSSSSSSLTDKVRAQKAIAIKQDWAKSKDILPISAFGLDLYRKAQQQQTAELFTVEKGTVPLQVPGALKRLKLLLYQPVEDWSAWAREQVYSFSI
jgi:hypothetical protein